MPAAPAIVAKEPESSPALRSLEELQKEWKLRRDGAANTANAGAATDGSHGGIVGGEHSSSGVEKRRQKGSKIGAGAGGGGDNLTPGTSALPRMPKGQQASADPQSEPKKSESPALQAQPQPPPAPGRGANRQKQQKSQPTGEFDPPTRPQDVIYSRERMLQQRPRPGRRSNLKRLQLPTTLEIPREDDTGYVRRSRYEQEDELPVVQHESMPKPVPPPPPSPPSSEEQVQAAEEPPQADSDPLVGAESVDVLASLGEFFQVEEVEEQAAEQEQEAEAAGVSQSRGFSKWFGGARPRSSTTGETGVSTDAGSGVDESSDDEVVAAVPVLGLR